MVRDFKYHASVKGFHEWNQVLMNLKQIKSPQLRPLIDAFIQNVDRTNDAAIMPAMIAWWVRRDQTMSDIAMSRTLGKLEPHLLLGQDSEPNEKYVNELKSVAEAFYANMTLEKNDQFLVRYGIGYVDTLLEQLEAMRSSID